MLSNYIRPFRRNNGHVRKGYGAINASNQSQSKFVNPFLAAFHQVDLALPVLDAAVYCALPHEPVLVG